MRKFIDIITEFEKAAGSGLPPATLQPDRGGEERGGEYWVGPKGKIKVPVRQYGASDHAQMVYLEPETFGLTWDEVMADVEPFEFHARNLRRWKHNQDNDPKAFGHSPIDPENTLGGRGIGQNILFRRGWVHVRYEPPQRIAIMGSATSLSRDIEYVMEAFPLMQIDEVRVLLYNAEGNKWDVPVSADFRKKDHPGFGGPVSAMMEWLGSTR